jgi:DNA topoisomerase-2
MEYKNFLESLIIDSSVTDEKLRSKQILQDLDTSPGDKIMKFTLHFSNETQLNELLSDPETFEKQFGLSHTISTSNMHLFNEDGIITKYANPEDILAEYCRVRTKYYGKRKEYLLKDYERQLLQRSEKIRFITYINDDQHELKVQKRRKPDIIQLLEKYSFAKFPSKKKKRTHKEEEDEGDEGESTSVEPATYEYLLKMRIDSLTAEMIAKLQKEHDDFFSQLEKLRALTLHQLWTEDLGDLKQEMRKFEEKWCKDYSVLAFTPRNIPKIPVTIKVTLPKPSQSTGDTSHGNETPRPKVTIRMKGK